MFKRTSLIFSLSVLFLAASSLPAAATVVHGNFVGTKYDFEGVQETTITAGDPAVLFGAPTVSGDSLLFNPTAFNATSTGGGIDTDHSELDLFVQAKHNNIIEQVLLTEAGDSSIFNPFAAPFTGTAISIGGTITVLETQSGGAITPIIITFADFGGDFAPVYTPSSFITANGGVAWTGGFAFDLTSIVPDATRIQFTLNNILTAASDPGTSASISKKVTLAVIPEPATGALIGMGLVILSARSRKERS